MKTRIEVELPCGAVVIAWRDPGDRSWWIRWRDSSDTTIMHRSYEVHPDSLPGLSDLFKSMAANTPKDKSRRVPK